MYQNKDTTELSVAALISSWRTSPEVQPQLSFIGFRFKWNFMHYVTNFLKDWTTITWIDCGGSVDVYVR
jgi:hypothetical protein